MNSSGARFCASAALMMSVVSIALMSCCLTVRADEVGKGRRLAERLCADCHMNEGQGEKSGPLGIPSFAAVANRPNQTLDGVIAWLQSVPPMMPNHRLSQDEMYALAAYVLSLRETP